MYGFSTILFLYHLPAVNLKNRTLKMLLPMSLHRLKLLFQIKFRLPPLQLREQSQHKYLGLEPKFFFLHYLLQQRLQG